MTRNMKTIFRVLMVVSLPVIAYFPAVSFAAHQFLSALASR